MSYRFYPSLQIMPGVYLNRSQRRASLTIGRGGLHVCFGLGGIRRTMGSPGTRTYYHSIAPVHFGDVVPMRLLVLPKQTPRSVIAVGSVLALMLLSLVLGLGVLVKLQNGPIIVPHRNAPMRLFPSPTPTPSAHLTGDNGTGTIPYGFAWNFLY